MVLDTHGQLLGYADGFDGGGLRLHPTVAT